MFRSWTAGYSLFQSTCPRGARPRHTPNGVCRVFQSTCPRGARRVSGIRPPCQVVFQSTCPRGARLRPLTRSGHQSDFNPRAHEGHDVIHDTIRCHSRISIHVPTRGTTSGIRDPQHPDKISIHVPTRGTTPPPPDPGKTVTISIHVPTRGTTGFVPLNNLIVQFQSTCPRGARLYGFSIIQ